MGLLETRASLAQEGPVPEPIKETAEPSPGRPVGVAVHHRLILGRRVVPRLLQAGIAAPVTTAPKTRRVRRQVRVVQETMAVGTAAPEAGAVARVPPVHRLNRAPRHAEAHLAVVAAQGLHASGRPGSRPAISAGVAPVPSARTSTLEAATAATSAAPAPAYLEQRGIHFRGGIPTPAATATRNSTS